MTDVSPRQISVKPGRITQRCTDRGHDGPGELERWSSVPVSECWFDNHENDEIEAVVGWSFPWLC